MAVAATAVARLSWPSSGAPLVVLVPVPVPLAGSHAAMPGTDLKHIYGTHIYTRTKLVPGDHFSNIVKSS